MYAPRRQSTRQTTRQTTRRLSRPLSRWPGRAPARGLLTAAAVAVAALAVLPAVYLVIRAAEGGQATAWDVLGHARTYEVLLNTAGLTAAVTVGAIAVGAPLAWLTVRTDVPARGLLTVLLALPLALPSYVAAYAYVSLLGPRGLVQGWLEPLGVDRLPSIYGFWGAWAVLTVISYPYVFLTVRAALRRMDPSAEEASRTLGQSAAGTFRRVLVPALRPALAAGGLLVALYTLSDFGAVSMLRFDAFTRVIYVRYGLIDRSAAAVLALLLVVLAVAVLIAEMRTRRAAAAHTHAGARYVRTVPLGRWRWPACAGAVAVFVLGAVLPVAVMVLWLVRGIRAGYAFGGLGELVLNSMQAAGWGTAVAVVAAWPVAILTARHTTALTRVLEPATWIGYALPGVVVALGLVSFGARHAPALYQTMATLVVAYVVMFLPLAVGPIATSVRQVNPAWEHASRTLGHGPRETFRRVVLPLSRPGVTTAAALVFLTVMKELPATLMLAPTGFSTLATQVWSATTDNFYGRAAAPALTLVLLASLPAAALALRDEIRPGRSGTAAGDRATGLRRSVRGTR
ncbi:ABC transporter permease [Phytoactinopolyspora halotolerans]|uniref:Iron ABC transporter permease n=1 Tax=Phytoactinopolyspora halotolerans TaxID=1981512 RepID=A0A6L9SBB9_9ACTN|nr:iron ABC transporter permease [Phytoactinopolyspora halotolerans]NEE01310.1 iron ABC transporter permease [Phytoactinopolyspora halotolerans]